MQTMDLTSQHQSMSISLAKIPKIYSFRRFKRYETQISLDVTLEIRSQAKGHRRYGLGIFREDVKLFKGMYTPSFVTMSQSFRELFSENPRGLHHPLCRWRVKLTFRGQIVYVWFHSSPRDKHNGAYSSYCFKFQHESVFAKKCPKTA